MCDWSFCIGIPDNCASSPAKTSLHTTSQALQINTIIPLKSRKNFNVYLPAQGVFFFFLGWKEVTVRTCIHKIHAGSGTWSRRRRYERFDHSGSVMATHRVFNVFYPGLSTERLSITLSMADCADVQDDLSLHLAHAVHFYTLRLHCV